MDKAHRVLIGSSPASNKGVIVCTPSEDCRLSTRDPTQTCPSLRFVLQRDKLKENVISLLSRMLLKACLRLDLKLSRGGCLRATPPAAARSFDSEHLQTRILLQRLVLPDLNSFFWLCKSSRQHHVDHSYCSLPIQARSRWPGNQGCMITRSHGCDVDVNRHCHRHARVCSV